MLKQCYQFVWIVGNTTRRKKLLCQFLQFLEEMGNVSPFPNLPCLSSGHLHASFPFASVTLLTLLVYKNVNLIVVNLLCHWPLEWALPVLDALSAWEARPVETARACRQSGTQAAGFLKSRIYLCNISVVPRVYSRKKLSKCNIYRFKLVNVIINWYQAGGVLP